MEKPPSGTEARVETYRQPVLVTGGAGLLGTSVVQVLQSAGHPIVVLDDGSAGTLQRLDKLAGHQAIRVYRGDLRDRALLAWMCERERPSTVVHLAGRHFIPYCETHPAETWEVNVEGTSSLLEALVPCPPDCLLFASTADVYQPARAPHREGDSVCPPTVYGRSKLAAERIVQQATTAWETRVVITRLFNLYGPYDTVDHLIPAIVTQALSTDRIRLGDLTTLRDFVYIDDAANAVAALLTEQANGIYNVGAGTATSGHDVVDLVGYVLGRELTVVRDQRRLRRPDRHVLVADQSKLRKLLPRWPRTSSEEGLRQVIDACRGSSTGVDVPLHRPGRLAID